MSRSIRFPPGGSVTLEFNLETGDMREFAGPIGGAPITVSATAQPDAMALYLLSTAIIEATRAIEKHTRFYRRMTVWVIAWLIVFSIVSAIELVYVL